MCDIFTFIKNYGYYTAECAEIITVKKQVVDLSTVTVDRVVEVVVFSVSAHSCRHNDEVNGSRIADDTWAIDWHRDL